MNAVVLSAVSGFRGIVAAEVFLSEGWLNIVRAVTRVMICWAQEF